MNSDRATGQITLEYESRQIESDSTSMKKLNRHAEQHYAPDCFVNIKSRERNHSSYLIIRFTNNFEALISACPPASTPTPTHMGSFVNILILVEPLPLGNKEMPWLFQISISFLICVTSVMIQFGYVELLRAENFGTNIKETTHEKATTSFGLRIRIETTNQDLTTPATQRNNQLLINKDDRADLFGNDVEYKLNPKQEDQTLSSRRSFSRISNIKKVKRLKKLKPSYDITNNSDSWHKFDGELSNNTPSNGNAGDRILQPKQFPSHLNLGSKNVNIHGSIRKQPSEDDALIYSNIVSINSDKNPGVKNDVDNSVGNISFFSPNSLNEKMPVDVMNKDIKSGVSVPCSCFWSDSACGCDCYGSLIYDHFQELSKSFRPCMNFSFTINGGQHFSLPPNLFSEIGQIQNLHLKISNATFDYLFDSTPFTSAFRGVIFENNALIELLWVRVRRGWNWTPLEYLKSPNGTGVEIRLKGCGLRRLSSDFTKVADGNVRTVNISDSRLEMIGSGAFATFDELIHLRLPRNQLSSIRRTDLPKEPLYLSEIDLSNNRLESLEGDIFDEMPSLQTISLAGNPLRILSEDTFSTVIGRTYLQGLSGKK
ncbi:uncharacterized protein NPIL_47161 [Nephila pilipes]|uniref:Uncharacterized protein n=1 Tax=Nephila pilipes TaxID=299642 RepID=A0A8X6U8J3_NEPPI|nr:uncharacterized protein NPIL_47161 [Nephila pilipes]